MKLSLLHAALLLASVCLWLQTAAAHPISLSAALVDVRENQVTAEVEIMLEDLVLYQQIPLGEEYQFAAADLRQAAEKHGAFVLKYFAVRDAEGRRLTGELKSIDKSKIPDEGVPQADLMTRYVTYQLAFPMDSRQKFMTFTQTFGGPDAILPAVMDLMLLQNGILLDRPVQLTLGRPYTVAFDWEHPPTKPPKSLRELRELREEQVRQRLGIASYGGLYSFIYIARWEVRHEILVPLLTLERWLPIPRQDPEFLEVAEQEALRASIADFFGSRNPVTINGQAIRPEVSRLNFFGLNINDFALNAEPRRVGVYQARVGVILSYRIRQSPKNVELRWETFNQFAPFLRSVLLVHDELPREHIFRPEEPPFTWTGSATTQPAPRPVASSGQRLSTVEASATLTALLENTYRAFEQHQDAEVYDALATSVTGDLLRDLYLRIKRSLLIAEQGGAMSRVQTVRVVSVEPQPESSAKSFRGRCTWRVTGTVEHWGHVHTRENEYEALLGLRADNGAWKIAEVEVLGEKRIRFETSLRGYDQE